MTNIDTPSPRRRKARPMDERGSMAILLMVVLVGMMLSALLVPMIITQDRTTRFDSTRVQALNAAQAGIDVTLGEIRASVTDGIGVSSKLPCGPVSGTVNDNVSQSGVADYNVKIEYFRIGLDPVREDYPSNNAMKCAPGNGTFDAGATTPGYARLTSIGSIGTATAANGSTGGRTLTSTYVFRVSDQNLLGGLVQISPASAGLCLDAGSSNATDGRTLVLQRCSTTTPPAAQQVFAYRTDLTLQLLSSITIANPNGLCLNSLHTPAVSGNAVQLTFCGQLGIPAPYTEQWSYNDNGQYQAAQLNSVTTGTLPDLCMKVSSQAATQPVVLGGCGSSSSWIPSPAVGPGAAALPQWVNFSEFGRCLDVTDQTVGKAYLIDYPCKQNPFPNAKTWNQLFTAPIISTGQPSATGQIFTTYNSQRYCLESPVTNGTNVTSYVTVKACDSTNTKQTWIIYGGDNSLSYSTKYAIVNGSLCLGLSAPNAEHTEWSTIDVETCTGDTEQKWNAVPSVLISALKNFHEN